MSSSLRVRVRFAVRNSCPSEKKIDLIMARLPEEVVLTAKGRADRRVKVADLNPREFGALVRQIVGEMAQDPNLEY